MPPEVIVTQLALLAEVQLHPEALILTMPLPPARGKDCREEERLVEQVCPALTLFSTTPALMPTTYSSPDSSSPKEDMDDPNVVNTLWVEPSNMNISLVHRSP